MVLLLLLQIGTGLYVVNHVVNSLCSRGPKGEGGPQGLKGGTGPQGLKGEGGPQGSRGNTGLRGLQGDIGPQGHRGTRGVKGNSGLLGVQGDPLNLRPYLLRKPIGEQKKLRKPSILEKEVSNMILADHPKGQTPTSGKHQLIEPLIRATIS